MTLLQQRHDQSEVMLKKKCRFTLDKQDETLVLQK